MKRILYYCTIVIASVLVIAAFVTAKNYTQLAIATVFYPILIFFILRTFPRRAGPVQPAIATIKLETPRREEKEVMDIDKREFLKLIGVTGLAFFVFSLFNKKVGAPLFGGSLIPDSTIPSTTASSNTGQSVAAGYKISEIDDSGSVAFYGFTNDSGGWLIMRNDTDANSFRYAKGASNFPGNWSNRQNLKYDYYYNLF